METIIGFAAGYVTGAQEGKAGLDRLRTSLQAIANSPEARRLAGDAVTMAGSILRRGSARGVSATASGVAELVGRRITEMAAVRRRPAA